MTDVRTALESTPIAGDTVVARPAQAPDSFRRVAAVAGIAAVAVGMVTIPLMGSAPVLGDSAEDVGAYFAGNAGLHRPAVVIAALLAIPMVLFFAGVHRALMASSGRSAPAWATVFLYGAIMMSATAGLKEALYAVAVRYAATEPDLGVLALLSDSSAIAGATLGAWMAVTVGAVGLTALRGRTAPRWYAGLSCLVAGLAVVSTIETVSPSTGGALSGAAFGSFILWMLTSAVVMLRRPLFA